MKVLNWLGIGLLIILALFVLMLEVAWAHKQFDDYRERIVRETVEALKNERR